MEFIELRLFKGTAGSSEPSVCGSSAHGPVSGGEAALAVPPRAAKRGSARGNFFRSREGSSGKGRLFSTRECWEGKQNKTDSRELGHLEFVLRLCRKMSSPLPAPTAAVLSCMADHPFLIT